jgi:xanthine/uracil permease
VRRVKDKTVPDNQYQENLEIVKLRIAYLQHLTTLGGAATLIVLAVMQRTETPFVDWELAVDLSFFGFATLVYVLSVARLINHAQWNGRDLESSAGQTSANLAGAVFAGGVVSLMVVGSGFL